MKKVKLGEVCEILSGYAFKSSQFNDKKIGLPLIRIRDVERGFSDTYFEGDFPKEYLIHRGDLLITMDGSFIMKKWEGDLALLNQRVCKLRITDENVDEGYLSWMIPKFLKEIEDKTPFVTVKHLSVAKIKNISFFLPDIQEQKIISKKLDTIRQIYNFRKKQSEKYNELVKSRFNEMFGDIFDNPQSKLEDHTELNPNKREELLNFNGDVSFIPMANVSENGKINLSINRNIDDVRKGFTFFKDNDVIVAKITPCFENGKGAPLFGLLNGIGFGSTEFHVLRPKNTVNTVWLYHVTMLSEFRLEGERKMTGSGGQRRIPKDFISNFKLNIPPLSLQNEFADFVAQVDKSQLAIQKSLEELETLKKSLMQEYFG